VGRAKTGEAKPGNRIARHTRIPRRLAMQFRRSALASKHEPTEMPVPNFNKRPQGTGAFWQFVPNAGQLSIPIEDECP